MKTFTSFLGLTLIVVSCSAFGPQHIPLPVVPPAPAPVMACSQSPTGNVNAVNFLVSTSAQTNWTIYATVPATNNQPVIAPAYPLAYGDTYEFVAQATNTAVTNVYSDYTAPIVTNVPPAPVAPAVPNKLLIQ